MGRNRGIQPTLAQDFAAPCRYYRDQAAACLPDCPHGIRQPWGFLFYRGEGAAKREGHRVESSLRLVSRRNGDYNAAGMISYNRLLQRSALASSRAQGEGGWSMASAERPVGQGGVAAGRRRRAAL